LGQGKARLGARQGKTWGKAIQELSIVPHIFVIKNKIDILEVMKE
jgi:hypothetical protein